MLFKYNDGGRAEAGYKGTTGDCVCRSIAIATEKPYQEVYDALNVLVKEERDQRKGKQRHISSTSSSRTGVPRSVAGKYMESLGWLWVPTMHFGSGCKVHLRTDELPDERRLIVRVSKHFTAVIDGVIHDTHNPDRNGTRCVYGYYKKRLW